MNPTDLRHYVLDRMVSELSALTARAAVWSSGADETERELAESLAVAHAAALRALAESNPRKFANDAK